MVNLLGLNFSLPLLAIPAYYVLAVFPHMRAITIASKGDMKSIDNRNPRSTNNIDSIRRRLTKAEFAAFERAESCHKNHLENMPLFVATIFAGLYAKQQAGTDSVGLESFVVGWMAIRVLYTINYLITETLPWTYVRSFAWMIGTGWACYTIGKAALVVGA